MRLDGAQTQHTLVVATLVPVAILKLIRAIVGAVLITPEHALQPTAARAGPDPTATSLCALRAAFMGPVTTIINVFAVLDGPGMIAIPRYAVRVADMEFALLLVSALVIGLLY